MKASPQAGETADGRSELRATSARPSVPRTRLVLRDWLRDEEKRKKSEQKSEAILATSSKTSR